MYHQLSTSTLSKWWPFHRGFMQLLSQCKLCKKPSTDNGQTLPLPATKTHHFQPYFSPNEKILMNFPCTLHDHMDMPLGGWLNFKGQSLNNALPGETPRTSHMTISLGLFQHYCPPTRKLGGFWVGFIVHFICVIYPSFLCIWSHTVLPHATNSHPLITH